MHQLPHVNNQELLSISAPTVRKIDQTTINQDRGRNDVNLSLTTPVPKKKKKKNITVIEFANSLREIFPLSPILFPWNFISNIKSNHEYFNDNR